jgi:hypothetical protein
MTGRKLRPNPGIFRQSGPNESGRGDQSSSVAGQTGCRLGAISSLYRLNLRRHAERSERTTSISAC